MLEELLSLLLIGAKKSGKKQIAARCRKRRILLFVQIQGSGGNSAPETTEYNKRKYIEPCDLVDFVAILYSK